MNDIVKPDPRRHLPGRALAVCVAVTAVAACADDDSVSPATTPAAPIVTTDIPYNEDPDRQILDVHVPDGDGPFPTILAIHGGGFHSLSKRVYDRHIEHYVNSGIAVVPINYRLAPSTTHPGQIEDVHCALAWVHEHADEYRLDPARIVAMGGSAGGYLTGMLATVDDRDRYLTNCPHDLPADPIAGAVPMYGIFDVDSLTGGFALLADVTDDEATPELLDEMSASTHIDGSEPPILAIHGVDDDVIPSDASEEFVDALTRAGVDAVLLLVEGGHGFDTQPLSVPPNPDVLVVIQQFVSDTG